MPNQTVVGIEKQPRSRLIKKKSQALAIKDAHGQQAVDFLR